MKYNKDARFYFANLGVDVARCVSAAELGDNERFNESLKHARRTLSFLRYADRPEAYEEGLLLMRALEYARIENRLKKFNQDLNSLIAQYAPVL
jgi:hypothetical protein